MAQEPSDDDVSNLCAIADISEAQYGKVVLNALRNSSNNQNQVMMEIFDDLEAFVRKNTWDESAFGANREGETNSAGIAFNVDAPDNAVIQGVTPPPESSYWPGSGAPSRPPSRTNNKSPLGPNSSAQEDEDLQRALAESARESGVAPQEDGIMDGIIPTSTAHFGPANRNDYDPSNWAMVPAGPATRARSALDPVPSKRQRASDAPAFLTGRPAENYGHNKEWWKGQAIYPAHLAATMNQGQPVPDDAKPDFNEEIHRLMAFLDATDRSYGSVEVMADLLDGTHAGRERQFFDVLNESNDPDVLKPLMHDALSMLVNTYEVVESVDRFSFLDFELSAHQWSQVESFYDVWDCLAWDESMTWQEIKDDTKMTVFREMGEIMTVLLDGDCPDTIDIPEVWYPERYLEARKEDARAIQEQLAWALARLYDATALEHEYKNWDDPVTHKQHDRRELLVQAVEQYEGFVKYLTGLVEFEDFAPPNEEVSKLLQLDTLPPLATDKEKDMLAQCEQVLIRCKHKLRELDANMSKLNADRDYLKQYRRYLNTLLTDPEPEDGEEPITFHGKKYLLRGVATGRDIMYICRRTEPQLIDLEEAAQPLDQWWRLAYVAGDEQPVQAEKVEFSVVKEKMLKESKNPLLVYATEDALNTPRIPLSDELQRFVLAENKIFRQELSHEADQDDDEDVPLINPNISPVSPSKRKYRANSVDSMDTNRASLGNSETNSRAGDFDDMDAFGSIDQPIELEATNNEIKLPEMQERGGNGSLFGSRHASASSASGRRDAAAEAMDVDASFSRQLD
ncbi:hypothetical protein HYQ45_012408 [Verticillium longisporum]|uniref:Ubiquitin interaction domain-containing protein n=1 Tax=Verticillium longisporum TaxID=100787 RepID=A0A8I3AMX5_VERLO|nr:hypothetical protein HYQ45_012408 [Verticillium longisporum]